MILLPFDSSHWEESNGSKIIALGLLDGEIFAVKVILTWQITLTRSHVIGTSKVVILTSKVVNLTYFGLKNGYFDLKSGQFNLLQP